MKIFTMSILILSFLSSCQTTGEIKTRVSPPDWVMKVPEIKGMICSIGMSDPTFYEEDAKINSVEIARKELAKTLSMEIKTIMIDIASARGNSLDEATVTQVSSWASNAVIQDAEILEYWLDTEGIVSQKKNSAYALGCMPRKFNKNELSAELINSGRSGDVNLQELSRTADEIIKHLEEKQE